MVVLGVIAGGLAYGCGGYTAPLLRAVERVELAAPGKARDRGEDEEEHERGEALEGLCRHVDLGDGVSHARGLQVRGHVGQELARGVRLVVRPWGGG